MGSSQDIATSLPLLKVPDLELCLQFVQGDVSDREGILRVKGHLQALITCIGESPATTFTASL